MINAEDERTMRFVPLMGLFGWVLCSRLLFPVPRVFLGDYAAEALADLALWAMTLLALILGLLSSWRILRAPSRGAVIGFAMATAIYIGLRALTDRWIYIGLWKDLLNGRFFETNRLLLEVNGIGIVNIYLYAFLVPGTFLFVLLWSSLRPR